MTAPARLAPAAVALPAFVAGLAVAAQGGTALVVYVPYAGVATLLVGRRPRHVMGWLLLATAWTFAVSWLEVSADSATALADGTAPVPVLLKAWAKWWWTLPVALSLIASIALVFPSGSLPSGRWRWPARALVAALVTLDVAFALWPVVEVSLWGNTFAMANPLWPRAIALGGLPPVPTAGGIVVFVLMLAAVVSVLVRLRRSNGVERLQLRWLVAAVGSIALAIPGSLLLYLLGADGFSWLPATLAFMLPPLAVGIAVLRYRLYEIDRIISRTIGWALVSGILIAVFAGFVVALQAALEGLTQGQTLAVAASMLVAFALFQPLRQRIQAAVDHRFDRARYPGQRTAEGFAARIRDEVDLPRLRLDLVQTADRAVRPITGGVWLRGGTSR